MPARLPPPKKRPSGHRRSPFQAPAPPPSITFAAATDHPSKCPPGHRWSPFQAPAWPPFPAFRVLINRRRNKTGGKVVKRSPFQMPARLPPPQKTPVRPPPITLSSARPATIDHFCRRHRSPFQVPARPPLITLPRARLATVPRVSRFN